jgi:hypothetical protein
MVEEQEGETRMEGLAVVDLVEVPQEMEQPMMVEERAVKMQIQEVLDHLPWRILV